MALIRVGCTSSLTPASTLLLSKGSLHLGLYIPSVAVSLVAEVGICLGAGSSSSPTENPCAQKFEISSFMTEGISRSIISAPSKASSVSFSTSLFLEDDMISNKDSTGSCKIEQQRGEFLHRENCRVALSNRLVDAWTHVSPPVK